MNKPRCLLIQFAKRPLVGHVKTRLIPDIGEDAAMQVHLALMTQTLEVLAGCGLGPSELWLDRMPTTSDRFPPKFYEIIAACQRAEVRLQVQMGADLGERMYQALATGLAEYRYVLLVGSDCPVLSADYLRDALELLESGEDVVFGPAEDGGYVLVGAHRVHPKMFANIAWGEADVLRRSLGNCTALDLHAACLEPLWDVDTRSDLERWQGLIKKTVSTR